MNADAAKPNESPPAANGRLTLLLTRGDDGRLVYVDSAGTKHVGVEPIRAFPLTDPNSWIVLCDAEGHELVTIASPDLLPYDVRQVLETELARREFLPVIERIVDVALGVEPCLWKVETDRGPATFLVDGADAVRRLDEARCLVVDTHGVRYLIADRRRLDAHGRRLLEHYL